MKHFQEILSNLSLTSHEESIVHNFLKNKEGIGFYSISEILKKNGYINDSIELLVLGLAKNPEHCLARVRLAKEYYQLGFIKKAWTLLECRESKLHANSLAQKIYFELSLLLRKEKQAYNAFQNLEKQEKNNKSDTRFYKLMKYSGLESARRALIQEKSLKLSLEPEDTNTKSKCKENSIDKNLLKRAKGYTVFSTQELFSIPEKFISNSVPLEKMNLLLLLKQLSSQGFHREALSISHELKKKYPETSPLQSSDIKLLPKTKRQKALQSSKNMVLPEHSSAFVERRLKTMRSILENI